MTTVFYALPYGGFVEIQSNLHRINEVGNFLGGSFSNRDNVRAPIEFRRENQSQHFKKRCFLKKRPIHFHISRTSVIRLDGLKETSHVFPALQSTSDLLPKSTVSPRSDIISQGNSSYCHRSNTWSHLDQRSA